jgi:quercetin dioxygenase-like cupin family protein
MGSAARGSAVVRAGGGETIFERPERTIRILADRDELTLTWFRLEPGVRGPDPHVHERHTDAFYVLAGELELGLGPDVEWFTASPGTLAAAPPKVVHTFRNASRATTVFLNIHAPSMRFGEMLRAARDGRNGEAADFDQFDPPPDGGRPLDAALLRSPGEGDPLSIGLSSAVIKAEGAETAGFFALVETDLAPGFAEPVRHRHRRLVDSFYVVDGRLSLQVDDEHFDAGPGDLAFVPPGAVHAVSNAADETVRFLNLMAPGGLEHYLKDVSRAAGAAPPDPGLMAEIAFHTTSSRPRGSGPPARRYGRGRSDPPPRRRADGSGGAHARPARGFVGRREPHPPSRCVVQAAGRRHPLRHRARAGERRDRVAALAVGFPFAITVTLLVTLALRALGPAPETVAAVSRPATYFIADPNTFSVMVATLAGIAGVLSLTTERSGALTGVLISVTTIPAAANVGVAAAYANWEEVGGALAQLGINLTCLTLSGIATLGVLRALYERRRASHLRDRS